MTAHNKICKCGCGNPIKTIPYHKYRSSVYIRGHNSIIVSEKTKKILSKKMKIISTGRKQSKETRLKRSISLKGHEGYWKNKKMTKEHRKKISDSHKGEKSNLWKGGITSLHNTIRHSFEYKEWRKQVFKRDDYTCYITNAYSGELIAHHIENFSNNENKRFDINNGVTLSKEIHKLFHKKYGIKNNTLQQLEEFKDIIGDPQ